MDVVGPSIIGVAPTPGDKSVKKQRRKRQKKLLVLLFLDYAKNTTLHGLRYIAETGLHVIEKIFWFVTFSLSLLLCSFLIFEVWRKWQTSPVIVSFNARQVSVEEVPFPSVTICPQSKFSQKIFNYTEFDILRKKDLAAYWQDRNNSDTIETAQVIQLICDHLYGLPSTDGKSLFNATNIQTLFDLTFDVKDVIVYCKWNQRNYRCSDLFKKVLTKSGVCYSFNGLRAQELFNDNVQTDYDYTYTTREIRNWTADGYTSDTEEYVYPFRDKIKMNSANLILSLNGLDDLKDPMCNSISNGYKVYLHHPIDYPQSFLYNFAVLPKQKTSMAVKFTMETAQPDLESYSVESRQCYFPNDKKLTYFRYYTFNNCMLECFTKYLYERCGCVEFYMPFHDGKKICTSSFWHVQCLQISEADFAKSNGHHECQCLPACNSIQYDAEIHKTDYLIGDYLDARNGHLTDFDYKRLKSSSIEIFYKQPMFKSVQRSVLFGLTDFLGNCGGLLGLFLGFSWLSLVEIMYFLTFRVYKTIKYDLKKEKTAPTQLKPRDKQKNIFKRKLNNKSEM